MVIPEIHPHLYLHQRHKEKDGGSMSRPGISRLPVKGPKLFKDPDKTWAGSNAVMLNQN
jgi:hypothetical protein